MKNWSHNHPAVRSWTHDKEMAKRRGELLEPHVIRYARQRRRKERIERIETFMGLMTMVSALFVAAWLSEHDAPGWVSIPVFFSMLGFALALLMESYRDDDLS